ncbi:DNA sulfur modification protein DndD [Candidatus Pelagibacter sp. HIMB1506]|uniref:DNA sulfur modification protein DndD n=1 Tax=Candidatus Pelagibacter sp. HIMB1506 TaxID=3413337 RepID=UPI003F82485B
MIFENLLINNFGVYCGKQNFDLSTKSKKPVILIGALNGSGKTTFLQAIDFVLYGKFSNYFYSQKLSYENFLTKNINKKNFDEGAQIELTFNRKYKGKKQKFKISRNWKLVGKKMKEEFFVFIDDKFDEDITKDWDNFVDQILPSRVASLFFFDGEKIEQLADLDQSKKVLKKAINSLLGLEIVDQLNVDVDEFQKRSSLQIKDDDEKKVIEEMEAKIKEYEKAIKVVDEKIVKEEDKLTKVKYETRELDIELSQKGVAYYDKKKEYEKEQSEIDEKRKTLQEDLVKVAASEAPLLIVEKELNEINLQSKEHNSSIDQSIIQEKINQLVDQFNEFSEKNCSDKDYLSKFKKFSDQQKIKKDTNNQKTEFLLKSINPFETNFLLNENLPNTKKDIDKLTSKKIKLDEEYEKVSQLINKIPSDDEIKPLIEKSKKLKKEEETLITKMNLLREERGRSNGPLIKLNFDLKKEYERKTAKDIDNLDNKRFIDYSIKVKDVLSSFHVKALDYHIKRLEKLILNCFKSLHRKKNFIKSIKIDTIEFDLKISDKKDTEINTEDLSAGERQLLAVAILWGLAKASNSAAPTIIDTPLGRLDSEHRFNLVEQYFPTASKQVILLSTDEEINKKYHKFISPYLSRSYKIEYDEKLSGSKLSEGYFF